MCCVVLQICSLLRGGIAERGGVRVGHRIIEINGQSVVAVPHERIVNLLATSVGEVSNHLLSMVTLLKTIAHIWFLPISTINGHIEIGPCVANVCM